MRIPRPIWSPKKPNEMSKALRQAVKLIGECKFTQSNKSQILYKEGKSAMETEDYIGAIDCFSESISASATNVNLYLNRALCYKAINDFENAYYDYSFAIRLEPDIASHYCNRGLCLSKLKRYQIALEDLDEACNLDSSPLNYYSRAITLFECNRLAESIKGMSFCDAV